MFERLPKIFEDKNVMHFFLCAIGGTTVSYMVFGRASMIFSPYREAVMRDIKRKELEEEERLGIPYSLMDTYKSYDEMAKTLRKPDD